ncbi:coiled-coil domain-containing protein 112-like [Cydia pomonella]|uniref:coiled-coil domain-containing protein 112-like n=1 Tax=Cydia pomonella TaxID=82600 RepID=UPI002ADE54D2|nr:coiled-coil domain-containing protein 112-like [Cydia pomonella]
MSYKRDALKSSLLDDSSDYTENSVTAKFRRLKIEENLLMNNINKMNSKEIEGSNSELPIFYSVELKNYTGKLKNNLTEIKNIFGELKAMAEEKVTSVDIDNMKRDVVKLDEKIRLLKQYVQLELASGTSKEKELTKQINDIEEKRSNCTFKPKIKIKPFSHIVPSPVKVMIQSPFKCKEVQNFQEFMMSSPNRYGGWNEYHHNIFVQIWQKYFKFNDEITLNGAQEFTCRNHDQYQAFQSEILEKITGSTKDDIVSHCMWYCKYLYLREQQQNALNKWKNNKRMLSKSHHKYSNNDHKRNMDMSKRFHCEEKFTSIKDIEDLLDTMETRDAEEIANGLCDMTIQEVDSSLEAEINKSDVPGDKPGSKNAVQLNQRCFNDILKPTKQWINRCTSLSEDVRGYNDLQMIKKLRIPDWRIPLQD